MSQITNYTDLSVPKDAENYLTIWDTVCFSRTLQLVLVFLHGRSMWYRILQCDIQCLFPTFSHEYSHYLLCEVLQMKFMHHIQYYWIYCMGNSLNSAVGIETRHGLDGPGIESRWGRDFPHPSRPALGLTSLLYNGYRFFPGGKVAGACCWPPTAI